MRPVLANTTGGLSGPAIKPLAIQMVNRVYRDVAKPAGIPLIGMGGVQTWRDAVEFHLAGATAIGVGTSLYADPTRPIQIAEGIAAYLARKGMKSVRELIGSLQIPSKAAVPPI
jgi:dihydroorotate dehydrogenase (NAD+) catalytic subunit